MRADGGGDGGSGGVGDGGVDGGGNGVNDCGGFDVCCQMLNYLSGVFFCGVCLGKDSFPLLEYLWIVRCWCYCCC